MSYPESQAWALIHPSGSGPLRHHRRLKLAFGTPGFFQSPEKKIEITTKYLQANTVRETAEDRDIGGLLTAICQSFLKSRLCCLRLLEEITRALRSRPQQAESSRVASTMDCSNPNMAYGMVYGPRILLKLVSASRKLHGLQPAVKLHVDARTCSYEEGCRR